VSSTQVEHRRVARLRVRCEAHPLQIVTSEASSKEKRAHMKALGGRPHAVRIVAVEPRSRLCCRGGERFSSDRGGRRLVHRAVMDETLADEIQAISTQEAMATARRLAGTKASSPALPQAPMWRPRCVWPSAWGRPNSVTVAVDSG